MKDGRKKSTSTVKSGDNKEFSDKKFSENNADRTKDQELVN
jgi:hypothetical protein